MKYCKMVFLILLIAAIPIIPNVNGWKLLNDNSVVAKTIIPDSAVIDNDYVKVFQNSTVFGDANPHGIDARVIVALNNLAIESSRGVISLVRGNVAVFKPHESYKIPGGEYFEVGFKTNHPPLKKPDQLIEPVKNKIIYDDEKFRIFEERLEPGDVRELHSHSQRVVVRLNEVQLTDPRFYPEGTPGGGIQVPNTVRFAEPMVHVVKNLSKNLPLFNIVIEFKLTNLSRPIFVDQQKLDEDHNQFLNNKSGGAVLKLIKYSDELLEMKPLSVMNKSITPPSGDKHDFTSMGPYWWPDPTKTDGLPYIRRDGERNPEYYKITDESYLGRTIEAVYFLTHAYYITKDSKYASKAAELLRVWFLNDETKMNPNMNHAQFIPGINTGRGIGLIETRELFKITDALILLRNSELWKKEDDLKISKWFEDYYSWITTHQYGIDESNEKNNHGTWYDVQKNAIAIFLGKIDAAKKSLEEAKHKRIDAQIEADGKQPLELARTKSWNYSCMNLSAFMHLAILGEYVGIDLWNYQTNSGGSIRKALDYLLQYALNKDKWEYKQISEFENQSLLPPLRIAQKKYDAKLYGDWIVKIFGGDLN